MLYSSLLVAVTALASFATAQNNTDLPPGIGPCCTVSPNLVNSTEKASWCLAETNTCREACGGSTASGGNNCDDSTLEFTCECRNGTKPDMALYQQTVPGQMCRFWFQQCINATNQNLDQQEFCQSEQASKCGNLTTRSTSTASASGATPSPTPGGSADATPTSPAPSSSSTGAAAALAIAREFGTPLFAGGIIALFGFAL